MKTLKHILAATTLLVTLGFASEANAQVPLEKRDTKSHRMANTSHIWLRMKTA